MGCRDGGRALVEVGVSAVRVYRSHCKFIRTRCDSDVTLVGCESGQVHTCLNESEKQCHCDGLIPSTSRAKELSQETSNCGLQPQINRFLNVRKVTASSYEVHLGGN